MIATLEYAALDRNILAVLVMYSHGWSALIGVVRGECHDRETEGVYKSGTRLDEAVARALFPNIDGEYVT